MSPLSTYYSSEVQRWMQQHPGRPITISQIGKLFGNAFRKAASIQTAVNGFKKTGVHPINPEIFEDWMFEPAETTNRPFEDHTNTQSEENDDPLPLITNASSEAPPKTPPRPTIFLSKPQETNNELTPANTSNTQDTSPNTTNQFYANATPSCSYSTKNFVVTPRHGLPIKKQAWNG
jgi:hypothetical protein